MYASAPAVTSTSVAGSGTGTSEFAFPFTTIEPSPVPTCVNSTYARTPSPVGDGGGPPYVSVTARSWPICAPTPSRRIKPGVSTLNGAPLAKTSPSVTGPVRNEQYTSPLKGSHAELTWTSVGSYVKSSVQLETFSAPVMSIGNANVLASIGIRMPSEIVLAAAPSACATSTAAVTKNRHQLEVETRI